MVQTIELSIVIPVFNEEAVLPELYRRIKEVCDNIEKSYEILFIDDGCLDGSSLKLQELHRTDDKVRVVQFTRNFGQQAAVLAVFRLSRGEIIVQIDSDLQNPPEEIPKLLDALSENYDLITTISKKRKDDFWRIAGSSFLRWFGQKVLGGRFILNLSSFRAMRRSVIEKIDSCSDRSRYMAVLASWMAVPSKEIEVEHHNRTKGSTKYGFFDLVILSWDLIAGFSNTPLRFVTYMGVVGSIIGFTVTAFLLFQRIVNDILFEGFIVLSAVFAFFAGVQLLSIGILGEYIGRIYLQVQNRPDYIVEKIYE
jgi:undecaprenyl-phosphate 4-deoxy-4-formamido-L-arabinose transferase